jgi:CheY-like chemotaxis protein
MQSRCHFLIVEHDERDVAFIRCAFGKCPTELSFFVCASLAEAKRYLAREEPFSDRLLHPVPTIVLSSVALGDGGGLELLRWIKTVESISGIPLVLMSQTASPDEVAQAYSHGAASMIKKTILFEKLQGNIGLIAKYWCSTVQTPRFDASQSIRY